jgi:hypothetical protein
MLLPILQAIAKEIQKGQITNLTGQQLSLEEIQRVKAERLSN